MCKKGENTFYKYIKKGHTVCPRSVDPYYKKLYLTKRLLGHTVKLVLVPAVNHSYISKPPRTSIFTNALKLKKNRPKNAYLYILLYLMSCEGEKKTINDYLNNIYKT